MHEWLKDGFSSGYTKLNLQKGYGGMEKSIFRLLLCFNTYPFACAHFLEETLKRYMLGPDVPRKEPAQTQILLSITTRTSSRVALPYDPSKCNGGLKQEFKGLGFFGKQVLLARHSCKRSGSYHFFAV